VANQQYLMAAIHVAQPLHHLPASGPERMSA
jgi:hypothetical protein